MKEKKTQEILDVILKGNNSKPKDLFLKAKNIETGDVSNVFCTYVDEKILFLYTSNELEPKNCEEYIKYLDIESMDRCWDDCVKVPKKDSDDVSDFRFDFIVGLETNIYFGDIDEFPLKDGNYKKIKDIERSGNDIILVY